MSGTFDQATLRRFLRSVRVATNTALAEYDLNASTHALGAAQFRALAAKGPGGWTFPEVGLMSGDGLVLATIERGENGTLGALVLQAQGLAGLGELAGRAAVLRVGGHALPCAFDRGGRSAVALAGIDLREDDLADFDLLPGAAQ